RLEEVTGELPEDLAIRRVNEIRETAGGRSSKNNLPRLEEVTGELPEDLAIRRVNEIRETAGGRSSKN
ncbi:hypothetical protein VS884_26505, partial [Escherichia coli]